MAAMGVPMGWEEEPVTGTGMCHTLITVTAAPSTPSIGRYTALASDLRRTRWTPTATKAPERRYHRTIHNGGRIPSEMCKAFLPLLL